MLLPPVCFFVFSFLFPLLSWWELYPDLCALFLLIFYTHILTKHHIVLNSIMFLKIEKKWQNFKTKNCNLYDDYAGRIFLITWIRDINRLSENNDFLIIYSLYLKNAYYKEAISFIIWCFHSLNTKCGKCRYSNWNQRPSP